MGDSVSINSISPMSTDNYYEVIPLAELEQGSSEAKSNLADAQGMLRVAQYVSLGIPVTDIFANAHTPERGRAALESLHAQLKGNL